MALTKKFFSAVGLVVGFLGVCLASAFAFLACLCGSPLLWVWEAVGKLRRRWMSRVSAAAFAALTLSMVHKSPALAADWIYLGGTNTSTNTVQDYFSSNAVEGVFVEDVFDFSVPIDVVSSGVWNAEASMYWGEYAQREEDLQELLDDILSPSNIVEDFEDFSVSRGFYTGNNTNMDQYVFGQTNATFGMSVFGSHYSEGVIDAITNPQSNLLATGDAYGVFNVPNLENLPNIFGDSVGGALAPSSPLSTVSPVVSGLQAPNTFFITTLSPEMIKGVDGGGFFSFADNPPQMFGYLSSLADALPHICTILNSHTVLRKLIALASTAILFFLMVHWWLRRIFYIMQLLTGSASGAEGRPFRNFWGKGGEE